MEKSCGVIIYEYRDLEVKFLLVESKENSYWGFPKGHMEVKETEEDTALREVFEEVGLRVIIKEGFREKSSYKVKENIDKEVVYFIGTPTYKKENPIIIQKDEIKSYMWIDYKKGKDLLTFDSAKGILEKAYYFILKNNKF